MVNMPVLDYVHSTHTDIDLSGTLVFACQHLFEGNAAMLTSLSQRGLNLKNLHLLPKSYSFNKEIATELQKNGAHVHRYRYDNQTSFDRQLAYEAERFLRKGERRDLSKIERIAVLDDGGFLLSAVNNASFLQPVVGVEQTSSGYNKLQQQQLHFPIANVARSTSKLEYESPLIAEYIVKVIKTITKRHRRSIESRYSEPDKALVIGRGNIGSRVALELSKEMFVATYDPKNETVPLKYLLEEPHLIIGASGSVSLGIESQKYMKRNPMLMSVSSSDREFDGVRWRRDFERTVDPHWNYNGENATLINGGFPITFLGQRVGLATPKIELTHALMLEGLYQAIKCSDSNSESNSEEPGVRGFFDVDAESQKIIVERWKANMVLHKDDEEAEILEPEPWDPLVSPF